jgi:hypothetical protein
VSGTWRIVSDTPTRHWCQALSAILAEAWAGLRPGRRPALPETFGLLGHPAPPVSDTLGHRYGVRHPAHFGPRRSCIFAARPRRGRQANADCSRDYAATRFPRYVLAR